MGRASHPNVDSNVVPETLSHLRDDVIRMAVKRFKVADPIPAEKRLGHAPVEHTGNINECGAPPYIF